MKMKLIRHIGAKMRGRVEVLEKNIRIIRYGYTSTGVGMGMGRTCKIFKKAIKL